MSGAEIMAVVGFILLLFGQAFAVWKYVDSKIAAVRTEASQKADAAQTTGTLAIAQLAEYKTHVAESYVTKQGMAEQTAQIMHGFDMIGKRLDGLTERLDRVFESKPARRS